MDLARAFWCSSLIVMLCATSRAAGQEAPAGVRAAGMGGAFTAIADDASAAVWNPAGLASGSYFSVVLDRNTMTDAQSALVVAIGIPPLGVTYYRTATALLGTSRNRLVAHHTGLSLIQSIGDRGVSVGATLKLVHGVLSNSAEAVSTNKFDADVGIMVSGSGGQIGMSIRNLLQPSFDARDGAIRLDRRVRGGVSLHAGQQTTVAGDAELTTTRSPRGPWRDAALGVEHHPFGNAWIRAGVHWNTAGQPGGGAAPTASIGGSYAIRGSLTADGQATAGSSHGSRGWGVGLRWVF